MRSKIYTLIFCLFLSNSNHNHTANSNQNYTKTINGWLRKEAGILYFTPIDKDIVSEINFLTIGYAHINKIKKGQPSIEILEQNIFMWLPELNSFLKHHNAYLSKQFLNALYSCCIHEHNNCRIISSPTMDHNSTIPKPPIIDGNP